MRFSLRQTKHPLFIFILLAFLLMPLGIFAEECEEGSEDPACADDAATYHELAPPFVVNLQDDGGKRLHFLQARIQVLTYGSKKIEVVKTHEPMIRDALITLLSAQSQDDMNTSSKKKKLQKKALEEVQKVLKQETGRKQIEGLYFTSFVVQ